MPNSSCLLLYEALQKSIFLILFCLWTVHSCMAVVSKWKMSDCCFKTLHCMKQVTSDATETQGHVIPFALLFCCHWHNVYLSQSIPYLFSFRTFLIAYDFLWKATFVYDFFILCVFACQISQHWFMKSELGYSWKGWFSICWYCERLSDVINVLRYCWGCWM